MNIPFSCRRVLTAICFILVPLVVDAGPPLICHPYEISDTGWRSLPGGTKDHFGLSAHYDRANLVQETLTLLTAEMPVIVRMETLRRAALYATNEMSAWRTRQSYGEADRAVALGLLQHLRERSQRAPKSERALALFDLGFYAETLRQTRLDPALDGYALIAQAAALRPTDPEIQFALALASLHPRREEHQSHLDAATAGAKPGSTLAKNLRTHFQR